MLAPRAPSAFVCLRCEVQIARRRLPAFARRPSHANFSVSARRRHGADEAEALDEAQQSDLKITREVEPLNRLRKRKGKVIRETSAPLGGLKQMGSDADILVLTEVGDPTLPKPEVAPQVIEGREVPDILASLQQEGTPTPEEVHQQIDSLRPQTDADPSEPHYVNQVTFVNLRKVLATGFKKNQLVEYYSAAKNLQKKNVYKNVIDSIKGEHGTTQRPVQRSEWQPGATHIKKRLPGLDVPIKRNNTRGMGVSRQLLVDRILRDAWNLVLLEEIEAPGELELYLKPWQIRLLDVGENETVLDKIRRTRRAKLEIFQDHQVLRITADKSTAEYAANDVEEALQNTVSKRMNLAQYEPLLAQGTLVDDKKWVSLYSQHDFDVVSKLTRTSIDVVTDSILAIRSFDEQAAEEARRTLLRLLPFKDPTTRTFDTQKVDAEKNSSYLLPVYVEEKSLDHNYRNVELGRMSMPIARLTEPDTTEDAQQTEMTEIPDKSPKTLAGLANRVIATIRRPTSDESKPNAVNNWVTEPEYRLSAEFGQVLFPLEDAAPSTAIKAALAQPSRSPFLPTFPGLTGLLTSPDMSAKARMQTPSLLYDFQPGPKQPNFEAGQMFPSLHIQMRTGIHGSKPTMHKLSLGFQHRIHDVLLPDKAADIRFFRYGRLRLAKNHRDKNVQEWAETVFQNIQSGGRLTAPPLRIDIPKWTIPGFPADAKGTRSVIYNFSGIQYRQTVVGDLLGTGISYSTVQAGKLGARGGALTAHYNSQDDPLLRDEITVKSFVKRCFIMVDKITDASTQTQPITRVIAPRRESSSRRMRRRDMEDEHAGNSMGMKYLSERVGTYPEVSAGLEEKEKETGDVVQAQDNEVPVTGEQLVDVMEDVQHSVAGDSELSQQSTTPVSDDGTPIESSAVADDKQTEDTTEEGKARS